MNKRNERRSSERERVTVNTKPEVKEIIKEVPIPRMYTVHEIAEIAHEINKAYCEALGDDTQLAWKEAPDWQKDSAVKGVTFHMENPEAGPELSHDAWLKEKKADGWKYGRVKDIEKKTHPCYVPYEKLPTEQKAKDYIFAAIVKAFTK